MDCTDLPLAEAARLDRLTRLHLLDTPAEPVFDGLTRLAASVTGCPIAALCLVDHERVWCKSGFGVPHGLELRRRDSLCSLAIEADGLFEIEDARLDPRAAAHPALRGAQPLLRYSAVPLVMPGGEPIGTLCVMSHEPGRLGPLQRRQLDDLAASCVEVILLREREHDRTVHQQRQLSAWELLAGFSPVGLCWANGSGDLVDCNRQWLELLELPSLADLAGRGWADILHPDDLATVQAAWRDAAARREPCGGVFRLRAVAGRPLRWLRFRTSPIVLPDGSPGYVGALVDATEAEQLQRELERKNQVLEAVIEHLPAGVAVFGPDLAHVLSNSTLREMLALPAHLFDDPGASFRTIASYLAARGEYGPGDVHELVERRIQLCLAGPRGAERTLLDGRCVENRSARTPGGLIVTTLNDVTAARDATRDLQVSRQRLQLALDASGLGLWEYDAAQDALFLAGQWEELLGLQLPEPARRSNILDHLPPEDRARLQQARRALLRGETARLSLEHRMRTVDGQEIWLLTEGQVSERGPDGRVRKVVGTCKNITARRLADAALQAALHAADEASRAKGEFLATMSHEIRTPINGVIGLTQLLSDARLPERESGYVTMIDSCAKSLLGLVDNILDFSKIEAGKVTLAESPTDLHALAGEIADVFTVRAAEKDIAFRLSVDPAVPACVLLDAGRLRQILLNLLGNAWKFTAAGGFSLHLRVGGDGEDRRLEFSVSDTGIGIAPGDQARLFTRFTQADASSRRRFQGTGLGLAISRELARLMGGDVQLASRPGAGSTFTLQVPLRPVEPIGAAAESDPGQPAVRTEASILLVEDNEVNRLVAQGLLATLGYARVTTAVHGLEALAATERERFDLVLMDCQMPEMDGLQATAEMRRRGLRMPVLALTAHAMTGDRERCLQAGMDDYLTKPIEPRLLAEKLHRWLGGGPAPAEPAPPAQPPAPDFDASTLVERFLGDRQLFARARGIFLDRTRTGLHELAAAAAAGDEAGLKVLAHKLKGSSGTIGAARLAALCGQAEAGGLSALPDPGGWLAAAQAALDAFAAASAQA